jgi:crossover junction endodeoxyribonuclease RusA
MSITLELPLPPSMNTYWRNFRGRTVLSAGGREYKIVVQEYVAAHNLPKFGEERLGATITIFPRDKRSIDLDNRLKALFDSLQDAGVFDDDSQFDRIFIARGMIKKGGGCTITISTLNEVQDGQGT